jgi:hypothetical protein
MPRLRRVITRHLLAASLLAGFAAAAHAARFTYHGELMEGDAPADGRYDLRLRALAAPGAKQALGEATELPGVEVIEGRFALQLDLPENPLGETFVEVAIRKADGGGDYEVLGTPQAVSKANTGCWALDGNTGLPSNSFLGIADAASNAPLELRVRNARVAEFLPQGTPASFGDAPGVRFGSSANQANGPGTTVGGGGSTRNQNGVVCPECLNVANAAFATVAGGGGNIANGSYAVIGGGRANATSTGYGVVAGGEGNASGSHASVLGGIGNDATGAFSTISGGGGNDATALYSAVGGGSGSQATGTYTWVGGGLTNRASGTSAVVPGGRGNCAGGDYSWAGGFNAVTRHGNDPEDTACAGTRPTSGDSDGDEGSFVWADAQISDFVSTGPNQFLVRAGGGFGINAKPRTIGTELTIGSSEANDQATIVALTRGPNANGTLALGASGLVLLEADDGDVLLRGETGVGINTAAMGAAADLRSSELVIEPIVAGDNADLSLFTSTNRGHGLVSEPGASGNPGNFYITEIDARTGTPAFFPKLRIGSDGVTYVQGGAVGNLSDARLKKDIAAIPRPLDTLLALQGHTFAYVDPAATMNPPGTRIGFVAQEVRGVLPMWISEDEKGRLSVVPSGFEALSVEAIRELRAEKDRELHAALEAIDALQRRVAELERRLLEGTTSTLLPR